MTSTIPGPIERPSDFPEPDQFPSGTDGLIAYGYRLGCDLVLEAYRRGMFPWYSQGEPVMWWSPEERCILLPGSFRLRKSLRKKLNRDWFELSINRACEDVIKACARTPRKGQPGTWLTPEMQTVYARLHKMGYVHSLEVWKDGELVGGLYGLRVGSLFCGESMFSLVSDASKAALATLCRLAPELGISTIDCQLPSEHLLGLGAHTIPRQAFLEILEGALAGPVTAPWPAGVVSKTFTARDRQHGP